MISVALAAGTCSADNWAMFGRTAWHASYSEARSALTRESVDTLEPFWTAKFDGSFAAAPIVVDRVLYVGSWNGYFYALNASDGSVLWQTYVGFASQPDDSNCQPAIGVTSQAVIVNSTVYVGGGDSAVYALDKRTGQQIWRLPLADPASGAYLWSSITAVANSLYIGVASLGDCPLVRGAVVRIDLANPQSPLVRYLVPQGQVGAGVWSTPAVDFASDTVYVTTGTGEQSTMDGVWGGTLLALDATTLDNKATFFLPTNSTAGDIEWGSSPTLFHINGGKARIAALGKDGILYVLDASDLSLIYQLQIAVSCICPECGCGSLSTPAFDGTRMFFGGGVSDPDIIDSGSVYSLDPETGTVLWVTATAGVVIAPVTVTRDLVLAGTASGLNIFDRIDGSLVWSDAERGRMYSQPVVVDGTVYCTYTNGEIVAWRPSPGDGSTREPEPEPPATGRGSSPAPRNSPVL